MNAPNFRARAMRITANQVSFTRIALLPLPVALLYRGPAGQWAAIVLFALLGITDYVDGYLARKYGSTEFGKFLDPISDKIMIAAMFVPLLDLGVFTFLPAFLLFARELSVTELRTIYNRAGVSFETSQMGKYKTNVQIFGFVIAVMNGLLAGTMVMPWLVAVLTAGFFLVAAALYLRTGRVHPYLLLFLSLFPLLLIAEDYLTLRGLHAFAAAVILFFTLYSGIEYYLGGWSHFRAYLAEAPARRTTLFLAQGFLVPAVFCLLVVRHVGPAWIPGAILALEFTCGGLDNFLTMHGKSFSYRWKAAELAGQVGPAVLALGIGSAARPLLMISLAVTVAYAVTYVFTHRADLRVGSRPTPAA